MMMKINWNQKQLKTAHSSNKEFSKKSEAKLARTTKCKLQVASGSLPHAKGDGTDDDFLYEDKATRAKQFTVTPTILKKLERNAFQHNKKPVLRIQLPTETFFVMPERVFVELLEKWKQ